MEFRKTEVKDIPQVMSVIEKAKAEIRKLEIDQWQDGYPDEKVIRTDIEKGNSYVIEENGRILGTGVLSFVPERPYDEMKEGKWLTDGAYGVIHRIAVDKGIGSKGVAAMILQEMERICAGKGVRSIKADTHEGNMPMKAFLLKNGFIYCGTIYLEENPTSDRRRVAFEKILETD